MTLWVLELRNLTKQEIVGIGVLKRVQVAVCGMHDIYLNYNTLKIFGVYLSYNEKLKQGNFLYNCNKYSMSIENLENEKPYIRRENHYF